MLKVIVIDDHDLVRLGICGLLEQIADVEVVAQGASGEEAISLAREYQPDIVFMDIRMPGIGGLEATRRLLLANAMLKVVVISALNDEMYPTQLLKAGAAGYITKNADANEIEEALRTLADGRVYVSPAIAQMLVVHRLSGNQKLSPLAQLSERELQIAQMITSGHRANEIAGVLNISPKTINTYKYRIYEKLNVSNDVELTLVAVKYGLVNPSEVI